MSGCTHVSYSGLLQAVRHVYTRFDQVPKEAWFYASGRLVNPRASYEGASLVSLYFVPSQQDPGKGYFVALDISPTASPQN